MREQIRKIKEKGGEQLLFVCVTIISAGVHFIYSIYVKVYVAPLEYGMYSTCVLLQTYLAYLQLGSLSAFNRDYPQLVGAGEREESKKYRNTVLSFLLGVYLIASILVGFAIIIIGHRKALDLRVVIGSILITVITALTTFENYANYRCRIDVGFKYSSIVTLLELLSIPIGVILVPKIGYYAIYLTSIIAMMIGIIFYYRPSFRDFKFTLDIPLLRGILLSGMPLLINGLIWTVVNSIDKFVILGFMDTEALGVYGIAQNAFSYMVLIPSAMSQLFYVKMGKEYGASGKIEKLAEVSSGFSAVLAAVTSFISMIAYFFLPVLVEKFMPNYSDGIMAAQILILGLSVYAATLINGNVLTILKKNGALLSGSICMCVFNAVCSIGYVIILGAKIESVALGTATSYILYALIIIYQVHQYANCKIGKLINASVIPVVISLLPGIMIYNCIANRLLGFIITIRLVIIFYGFFYRKQLLSIRN